MGIERWDSSARSDGVGDGVDEGEGPGGGTKRRRRAAPSIELVSNLLPHGQPITCLQVSPS